MKIIDFLGNVFNKNNAPKTINLREYRHPEADSDYVAVYAHALFTCVDLIATLAAGCEVKTFSKQKEIKSADYDRLNVQPNKNQSAFQFWKEVYTKVLAKGEALVVEKGKEWICADNFNAIDNGIDYVTFEHVTKGNYTFEKTFSTKDSVYIRYTNLELNMLLATMADFYSRQLGITVKKYRRSSEEKGILNVDAQAMGKDFEQNFDKLMNEYFKSYFSKGSKVLPLFAGYTYSPGEVQKNYSNEASDMRSLFEDAITRFAQAFKIPASLVRGDVAGIKEAYDVMLTNCIDPLTKLVAVEITAKLYNADARTNGSKVYIDTSNVKHADFFDTASAVDKLIGSGTVSPNDIRIYKGNEPIDAAWANDHYITRNYMPIRLAEQIVLNSMKGGESNGEQMGSESQ